ncbi:hypothetical protein EON73_02730 [bacterium]|nr:MAG: hypothetical protein EON73_02730 [bacterium]
MIHACSELCGKNDDKFFGLSLICTTCLSASFFKCLLTQPSTSMFEFGIYFSIIDENGEATIGSKERMADIRDQLVPIFGGRNSNFAFKCNHCKGNDAKVTTSKSKESSAHVPHEDSILNNNTLSMDDGNISLNGTANISIASKNVASGSNAVGSDKSVDVNTNTDTEIDDSLCIHVSKFRPHITYMDVAKFITKQTSLKFKKSFSVFKLYQRKFRKTKPTFVSFKIMAKDKEVFDIIMATDLWEPKFKASPYDRSISKAKAMERRSKRTSHELEAPQSKTNTDPKHGKQKSQPQNQTHELDKPHIQNQQHKKQQKQQQQTKRQQKQQQHRRGNQPRSDHMLHHNSAGNKKSRQSFKGALVGSTLFSIEKTFFWTSVIYHLKACSLSYKRSNRKYSSVWAPYGPE